MPSPKLTSAMPLTCVFLLGLALGAVGLHLPQAFADDAQTDPATKQLDEGEWALVVGTVTVVTTANNRRDEAAVFRINTESGLTQRYTETNRGGTTTRQWVRVRGE